MNYSTTLGTVQTQYVTATTWPSDAVSLGLATILFAVAICLIVGARIVWLQQIGQKEHKPIARRK